MMIWSAGTGPWNASASRRKMISGVPHHVDGRMSRSAQDAGAAVINLDRMALYGGRDELGADLAEPWHSHSARPIVAVVQPQGNGWSRPSAARFRHTGLSSASCRPAMTTPGSCSRDIKSSRCRIEQNPDMTSKLAVLVLEKPPRRRRALPGVGAFKQKGEDFIVHGNLEPHHRR